MFSNNSELQHLWLQLQWPAVGCASLGKVDPNEARTDAMGDHSRFTKAGCQSSHGGIQHFASSPMSAWRPLLYMCSWRSCQRT